ncbi:uncharacterized protein LOC142532346 [Primulina tabacum]|uniref:uncharacterized protein LOC142532346 n=1 Tax=Primulina tabacum TaxID=48773 RepID=UPI003F592A7A
MLPDDNELPLSLYDSKKSLCALGMDYVKIHACRNDGILYRKEYEDFTSCPICWMSRWKLGKNSTINGGVPAKVLWYFPPIPRFQRWFQQKVIYKELTWHADKRIFDGYLRHPADAPCWKVVDHNWPNFASEPRNLRLAISADDINSHSVDTYDAYRKEILSLRVVLLWTINDFPAYGNMQKKAFNGNQEFKLAPKPLTGHEVLERVERINYRLGKMSGKLQLKVPTGYSSNIKNLVSMKDLKLVGLKSHDYHTLMQQLLPVAIRGVLPKHVRDTITLLCGFFNVLYNKVIDVSKLDEMQREIVMILCLLEKYFPPSFFVIMIHLTVHLVREIKLCGPVWFRHMYPFERFIKILKGYVQNCNRPEGCIAERYIAEEPVEFCSNYMSNVDTIGIPSMHRRVQLTKPLSGSVMHYTSDDELNQAHRYLLENDVDVEPYIEEHMTFLAAKFPHKAKSKRMSKNEKPKQNTAYSADDNSCGGKKVLESTETETTRSSRGHTRLDRLVRQRVHGIRKDVKFNKLGQPIEEFAGEMQNYIGVLVREKKLRDEQKKRRKQNIYLHRMSRKGYARFADEIVIELCDDDDINRAIMWKKGQVNKKGEYEGWLCATKNRGYVAV